MYIYIYIAAPTMKSLARKLSTFEAKGLQYSAV